MDKFCLSWCLGKSLPITINLVMSDSFYDVCFTLWICSDFWLNCATTQSKLEPFKLWKTNNNIPESSTNETVNEMFFSCPEIFIVCQNTEIKLSLASNTDLNFYLNVQTLDVIMSRPHYVFCFEKARRWLLL